MTTEEADKLVRTYYSMWEHAGKPGCGGYTRGALQSFVYFITSVSVCGCLDKMCSVYKAHCPEGHTDPRDCGGVVAHLVFKCLPDLFHDGDDDEDEPVADDAN